MNPPLAEQLRPKQLSDYIGQSHLMGEGAVLHKALLSGTLPSMVLWGPPGVGKTTLAYLISLTLNRPFFTLSAVQSGVKEVRDVLQKAEAWVSGKGEGDSGGVSGGGRSEAPSLFDAPEADPDTDSDADSPGARGAGSRGGADARGSDTRGSSRGSRANANSPVAPPILFIDEIHRFSKSQQDSLLSAVEKGIVTFIGATTENPSFEVITPLLSRCQVFVLQPLSSEELDLLIGRAVRFIKEQTGLTVEVKESAALKRISGGDGRKLLNALDMVVSLLNAGANGAATNAAGSTNGAATGTKANTSAKPLVLTDRLISDLIQQNLTTYDKDGENHYDIISAFIKSLRGSDPNAAVYYLARMLASGEDVKFIARRMVILASEDIGNANPNALLLANACFDTVHKIGYPECRITLSQTAVYLACSPKSNASYMAIEAALAAVQQSGDLPVPLHLRNAPTKLMKELGYSDGYQYAHDFEGNFADLEFLPEKIAGSVFYAPGDNPKENEMRQRLRQLWKDKYGY